MERQLAWRSGALLAVLLAVESFVGLLAPGVFHDPPGWAAQARGVNLVDLVVALPTLVIAMVLARRGSHRAVLVWTGVVGYVLYNATIFAFNIAFNRLFLVYVGLLALSVLAGVLLSRELQSPNWARRFGCATPVRSISVYLIVVALLFLLAWLKDIVSALIADTPPASVLQAQIPTNPVYVLDLGFLIPLHIVTAVWLLRRRAAGLVMAGPLLVFNLLLSASIISSTVFQFVVDPSLSLAIVPLFGLIALASLVLALVYFRSMREIET